MHSLNLSSVDVSEQAKNNKRVTEIMISNINRIVNSRIRHTVGTGFESEGVLSIERLCGIPSDTSDSGECFTETIMNTATSRLNMSTHSLTTNVLMHAKNLVIKGDGNAAAQLSRGRTEAGKTPGHNGGVRQEPGRTGSARLGK